MTTPWLVTFCTRHIRLVVWRLMWAMLLSLLATTCLVMHAYNGLTVATATCSLALTTRGSARHTLSRSTGGKSWRMHSIRMQSYRNRLIIHLYTCYVCVTETGWWLLYTWQPISCPVHARLRHTHILPLKIKVRIASNISGYWRKTRHSKVRIETS